ncbi:phosphoadenosine phosphosulfate reductase [Aphanomyces invadans]|uniref:Phosphoadenosine phosphosulfate reductase n=1 Tax=Aphanomyces invadans TaxID=157072 RepID=A0A024TQR5_9STRA|nr:phosphoadenosine phosphosulfate reductase [Aphanomyces invadans]ETV96344.1 phosphoadenosine phosphosulfate reductase [Aphanomyces invadans]RHY24198.1 hypothetical protein DYB32_008950 [Aphanomyces invadans]|eukprot:XP_008875136.1 phosphoadenosine phosphosulfate reductase [Aphanomyces invadans]
MQRYTADEWTWRGLDVPPPTTFSPAYVAHVNAILRSKSAAEVVMWAADTFGPSLALSSSFGIQSAVMLHLVSQLTARVPVVWIDTGYLPPETYAFAATLQQALDLNLHIYQPKMSPAHMEAVHGKLYESSSAEDHQLYGRLRKVEPMERGLTELGATALLVGLRADQTSHRRGLDIVHVHNGRLKICPILHWTQQDVDAYMARHNLPYHPLKALGYATVGDAHSSRPVTDRDTDIRATRFRGHAQECGLHLSDDNKVGKEDVPPPRYDDVDAIVYSKPACKFCSLAKDVLARNKWSYKEVIVGKDISYPSLCHIVGKPVTTVPQIFVQGQYIGGYTELDRFVHTAVDRELLPPFQTSGHIHASTSA